MSSSSTALLMRGIGVLSLLSVPAVPVFAQETSERTTMDTIVVTGERVERSLRNTASSVTPVSAEDIESKVNSASVAEAIADVPNVIYNGTVSAPIIRGQDTQGPTSGAGAFLSGTVPRATVNVDGRYLSYNELVFGTSSIWDLSGIEVYRGPQTSAQGANSIAGAIVVNTKNPTYYREGAAQLLYGSNNTQRASVAYATPIIDNELAIRIAADYSARDTFIRYVNPAFAKGKTDQDFSAVDARLKVLWEPSRLRGLRALVTVSHNESTRPTYEVSSNFDVDNTLGSLPSFDVKSDAILADVSYELDNGMKISNRTGFSDIKVHREIQPFTAGGADIKQNSISNETRLNFGNEASQLSGMVGLFYNRTRSDEKLVMTVVSPFDDVKENVGMFSELTYRLTDRWRVTGGLRYQHDNIQRKGTTNLANAPLDYNETFSAVLPKVSLAYDLTKEITVGALVNKGYNPGGVSLNMTSRQFMKFTDETVWNYELFSRASLLGGRLMLTGNVFYSKFTNSQRVFPNYLNGAPYGSFVVNADKSDSYGTELGMDYLATDNLRVRAGLGLLKTKIDAFTVNGTVHKGREFASAPEYTANLGLDWDVTSQLKLAGDVRHVQGYYSSDENLETHKVGGYTIANARMSYKLFKNTELFSYVNNVFNKRAASLKTNSRSGTQTIIVGSMNAPREFGVGLKMAF